MKKSLMFVFLTLFLCPLFAGEPKIQIAILLDTSSSMDGLINQARTRLWAIVNEMSRTRKNGKAPILEVGLYEYGKSTLPQAGGYIDQLVPLTTDLDKVSEALFALTTNGGDEFCGQVIDVARLKLEWSREPEDYRAIFIAGNEAFDQGSVSFRMSCPAALAGGIVVNTIYCGDDSDSFSALWKMGAQLGGGKTFSIDKDQVIAEVKAPQDAEILKLGQQLNETYIAYGASGAASKTRQKEQDAKAAGASTETAVQRTMAKASPSYRADKWDLVDAAEKKQVDVTQIEAEALPEPMRAMDDTQKRAYIKEQADKRKQLQTKIADLQKERAEFLAKTKAEAPKGTLDDAVQKVVREQLKAKHFTNEKK